MSEPSGTEPTPATAGRRRASFAGIIDMFSPTRGGSAPSSASSAQFPGPISQAAAQAQQRRLSINTIGLGSSSGAASATPFGSMRSRGLSIASSSGSASVDESPFEDGDTTNPPQYTTSSFARRMSSGARALRDYRTGPGGGGPGGFGGGGFGNEGFNFADSMRARAERGSNSAHTANSTGPGGVHARAKNVAVMEPPVKEVPAVARKPDQFQERILKGDFYMD